MKPSALLTLAALLLAEPSRGEAPPLVGLMESPEYSGSEGADGLMVEIARSLANRPGIELAFRVLPPKRALRDYFDGDLDMVVAYHVPLVADRGRSLGRLFCTRLLIASLEVLPLVERADLHGLRIGYVRGGYVPAGITAVVDDLFPVRDYDRMRRVLEAGRVDAVLLNGFVLERWRTRSPVRLAEPIVLDTLEVHLWLSTAARERAVADGDRFAAAVRALVDGGGVDALVRAEGATPEPCP